MKIGIIGASGFIGAHLTEALESNSIVSELHLFSRSIREVKNDNSFYHKLDLKNSIETFPTILKQLEIIYLLHSESTPSSTWEEPIEDITRNVLPTLNLLKFIEKSEVKKVIFASSSGTIYGETNHLTNENQLPNPFTPYAISKLSIENYLEHYRVKSNLNYSVLRISNVYGRGQKMEKGIGLMNTLIENFIHNKTSTIYGDGSFNRNYIHVNDVVLVLSKCLELELFESQLLNLCSDDNVNINQVISIIEECLNIKIPIQYARGRESDNPSILVSNEKLKHTFKNLTFTPLFKGIKDLYESKIKSQD